MKYLVTWRPDALNALADLWNNAPDRVAISAAADQIDAELERNPSSAGESREKHFRLYIVSPLAISFEVDVLRGEVTVWSVWRIR